MKCSTLSVGDVIYILQMLAITFLSHQYEHPKRQPCPLVAVLPIFQLSGIILLIESRSWADSSAH